jgi:ABC-2 type transport system permease protein
MAEIASNEKTENAVVATTTIENATTSSAINLKKVFFVTIAIYIIITVLFYFLAGDQLRFRESRGNTELPPADAAVAELTQGIIIEQTFTAKIQRLDSISVQWTNFYRENAGAVTMQLVNPTDGTIYMEGTFDATTIGDGQILTMTPPQGIGNADDDAATITPLEGLYNTPLTIRITADSVQGSATAPLKSTAIQSEGDTLTINGAPTDGTLCFNVHGTDYIWTGLHYWKFMAVGLAILIAFMLLVWYRYKNGRRSYLINALIALKKYEFLIHQLVSRDFKTKYKRSVLGIFWSFLNPLLMMIVQYVVFSTIFRFDIENYVVYLLIGIVSFNFFSEVCSMSMTSILGNASLITKVYLPKYIYPLTRTMSSGVNLLISLLPLILMCIATGLHLHKSAVLALFFLGCLAIFSLGMGLLLSSSMVFFRDTQYLWGILSMAWMYATPIFYPASLLQDHAKILLTINPIYHFIDGMRVCIMDGISPEPIIYIQCMAIAIAMLLVGAAIFKKSQNKFVLYL